MTSFNEALGAIWTGTDLQHDFDALCDCGGRLAGSESEAKARGYLDTRLAELGDRRSDFTFEHSGNFPLDARVTILPPPGRGLETVALPGSPATPAGSIIAEVVDVGLGTEHDFAAVEHRTRGRAVLVRHEYPFTTGHTHRRDKYQRALRHGAKAFLIANDSLSGPIAGTVGTGSPDDIPAAGISAEAGEELARATASGAVEVELDIQSERRSWPAVNLILDLPGSRTDEKVLVCAHYDGHQLAESAIDNATGAAAVLEIGRRIGPLVSSLRRGLRLALFTVEEWDLAGSRRYVQQFPRADRESISTAIALDSIAGHPRMSALTTESDRLERLVATVSGRTAVPIDVTRPALANSDHHSFYAAGIPSMRLMAGYGRAESLTRRLLTAADTRSAVDPAQLKAAVTTAALLVHEACDADP